jgi:NADH-ubiquinone oxidoreductase chain 1
MFISPLFSLSSVLIIILPTLLGVAFVTIAERKTMASLQRRVGPNIVGIYGLLQAFADALKLLIKEYITPTQANILLFFLGPIVTLIFSLYGYAMIPYGPGIALSDFNLGILYMLAVSSLATYGILLAGWSANSKYAFLGSLRSTAQLISYELILSSALLVIVFLSGTFNLSMIIEIQKSVYFFVLVPPLYIIFYIAAIAETNRAPFDLAEAESELVSGFMTEHAAGIFVFFFLAEYASIILICILISIVFLGGYDLLSFITTILNSIIQTLNLIFNFIKYTLENIFLQFNFSLSELDTINKIHLDYSIDLKEDLVEIYTMLSGNNLLSLFYPLNLGIKSFSLVFLFILIRASYPRLRFDKLMSCCWTELLPITISIILFIPCITFLYDIIIYNV